MVIVYGGGDESVATGGEREVADSLQNDSFVLLFLFHRLAVPDADLGFGPYLSCGHCDSIGSEGYGSDVIVMFIEERLGIGVYVEHYSQSSGMIDQSIVLELFQIVPAVLGPVAIDVF